MPRFFRELNAEVVGTSYKQIAQKIETQRNKLGRSWATRRQGQQFRTMAGGAHGEVPSQEELVANRVPISCRDACANLLIPLNKCRSAEYWLPWKCVDERHSYEKCEYELFLVRLNKMKEIREDHFHEPQHATA